MTVSMLAITDIRIDGGTQVRVRIDPTTVEQYKESYELYAEEKCDEKYALPPLEVVHDGSSYWLWDGFHRLIATEKAGFAEVLCNVQRGTIEDARWLALSANKRHGLQLNTADKRRAVELALRQRPDLTDRAIARHTNVSHPTVSKIRKEMGGEPSSTRPTSKDKAEATAEKDPPVTPDQTEAAARAWKDTPTGEPPCPDGLVDACGIPIQPHAREAWNALPQFDELLQLLSKAQQLFNETASTVGGEFLTKPDVSSCRRNGDTARFICLALETAAKQIKAARPTHTVCLWRYTDTPHLDTCKACQGLNWTPALGKSVPPSAIERAKRELL